MASVAVSSNCENLNCPICFKSFNTPRILPCLHTFCEECLGTHIKSVVQGGSLFVCPICKTPTVPPNTELTADKWASTFPLDNVIYSHSELSDQSDNFCDICKLDGENTTAKFWCIECQEKVCISCDRDHKRIKISRQHSTVECEEIKNNPTSVKFNFDQDCVRHRGEKQDLVCIDHREICCLVCFTEKHRQCNNIRNIDDVADEQAKRITSSNVVENMRKVQKEIDKMAACKSEKCR